MSASNMMRIAAVGKPCPLCHEIIRAEDLYSRPAWEFSKPGETGGLAYAPEIAIAKRDAGYNVEPVIIVRHSHDRSAL